VGSTASITRSYVISATPRTGSNFLCEVLDRTGVAGHPEEYFWQRSYWYERWGVNDFPSFIGRVLQEGTTPNGVFGSKLMWDQVKELVAELESMREIPGSSPTNVLEVPGPSPTSALRGPDSSPRRVLEATFPNLHYIWLRRSDRVRQAISYYRALETKRWRSTDTPADSVEPEFNFEAIHSLLQLSAWEDEGWQEFFARHAIVPLTVWYEAFAESPQLTANQIMTHLGLQTPNHVLSEGWRHQRQADALTDEWSARYLAEQSRRSNLPEEEVLRNLRQWTP